MAIGFKSFIKEPASENGSFDPEELKWNYLKRTCDDAEMHQCEKIYHYCKDNGIFEKLGARPEIMELVDLFYSVPYTSEESTERDPIYKSIIIKREVRSFLREIESYLNMMAKAELGNAYREGWMDSGQ